MARTVNLIVEDGSIVANANSFVDEAAIVEYSANRGSVLPFSTDEEKDAVAILGIKASDYLQIMPWKGDVVSTSQTMPWPRKNLNVSPAFPENQIPLSVIEAQLQLTMLAKAGTVLIPTAPGTGFLIKEEIGPIKNTYSEAQGVSSDGLPLLPGIKSLLDPWLLGTTDGFTNLLIRSVGYK